MLVHPLGPRVRRIGVAALRARLLEGRLRFAGLIDEDAVVDACHRLSHGDAIALARQQLDDSPGDLRRDLRVAIGKRGHGSPQLERVGHVRRLDARAVNGPPLGLGRGRVLVATRDRAYARERKNAQRRSAASAHDCSRP